MDTNRLRGESSFRPEPLRKPSYEPSRVDVQFYHNFKKIYTDIPLELPKDDQVHLLQDFNDVLSPKRDDGKRFSSTSENLKNGSPDQKSSILGDPGAVSGGGRKAKQARKKIGRGKVKNESRSPWDSSLNRPVPKPFKILACDWAQKYFLCPIRVQLFSCYFRDFLFETVYSLAHAGEFPSVEKCH